MNKQKTPPPPASGAPGRRNPPAGEEQRRIGIITRDERGQAIVDWVKAPKDWERRAKLELAENAGAASGRDPYQSGGGTRDASPSQPTRPVRTDLRRLSEHIKQMRALKGPQKSKPEKQK